MFGWYIKAPVRGIVRLFMLSSSVLQIILVTCNCRHLHYNLTLFVRTNSPWSKLLTRSRKTALEGIVIGHQFVIGHHHQYLGLKIQLANHLFHWTRPFAGHFMLRYHKHRFQHAVACNIEEWNVGAWVKICSCRTLNANGKLHFMMQIPLIFLPTQPKSWSFQADLNLKLFGQKN